MTATSSMAISMPLIMYMLSLGASESKIFTCVKNFEFLKILIRLRFLLKWLPRRFSDHDAIFATYESKKSALLVCSRLQKAHYRA